MNKHFIFASLLATSILAFSSGAAAQDIGPDALAHMTPAQARISVKKYTDGQRAARAHGILSGSDITAPVLTSFSTQGSVDATLTANALTVAIKASDDLSGIYWGGAYAFGPNGQSVYVSFSSDFPANKYNGPMWSTSQLAFLAPGTYTFDSAYVADVAGNVSYYDAAQLAALGRTSFTVKNKAGFDAVPPGLLKGRILTPQVSLGSFHPGTDQGPFAGVSVDLSDAGNTAVAGVQNVYLQFCVPGSSDCLGLSSYAGVPRKAAVTLRPSNRLYAGWGPEGEYHLYYISITDFAGNSSFLMSTEFGGETDFSLYFPSTTITVTR